MMNPIHTKSNLSMRLMNVEAKAAVPVAAARQEQMEAFEREQNPVIIVITAMRMKVSDHEVSLQARTLLVLVATVATAIATVGSEDNVTDVVAEAIVHAILTAIKDMVYTPGARVE